MGGRKKRFWSEEEKRSICHQTTVPGVSVAQVARRYALNANMIFKWLKDPRFAPPVVDEEASGEGAAQIFLPVEISQAERKPVEEAPDVSAEAPARIGKIEITLAGGHRITACGDADPDALARLLKAVIS